jgi:hypothetical protein
MTTGIYTAGVLNVVANSVSQALLLPVVATPAYVLIKNTGTDHAYVALGTSAAAAATTSSTQVLPGRTKAIAISTNTYVAVISPVSTALEISISQ